MLFGLEPHPLSTRVLKPHPFHSEHNAHAQLKIALKKLLCCTKMLLVKGHVSDREDLFHVKNQDESILG